MEDARVAVEWFAHASKTAPQTLPVTAQALAVMACLARFIAKAGHTVDNHQLLLLLDDIKTIQT